MNPGDRHSHLKSVVEIKSEMYDEMMSDDSLLELQGSNDMVEPFGDLDSMQTMQTIDSIADLESRDPLDGYQNYTIGPGGEMTYSLGTKDEELGRTSSDFHEIMLDGTDDESRYLRAGDESEDDHFSSSETLKMDPEALREAMRTTQPVENIAPITAAAETTSSWSNRFEVVLEASTAVAQAANEDPLSYLNKSQKYNIVFRDKELADETFTTSLCVCFHELKYQREEEATWKIWLAGQANPSARPLDLDRKSSSGISQIDCSMFNTILFSWNGKKGATVAMKINCLSTEFIKCKGVKGVQLRLQSQIRNSHNQLESSCCRIKVFRDKGAERKNRDDQKSLERKMEKIFKDNPNAKITINPPKPRTLFTSTNYRDPHISLGAPAGRRVDSTQLLAPTNGPAHPLPAPAPPSKTPATVFLMTTFPSGTSTKPLHQTVGGGHPSGPKMAPSPLPFPGTPASTTATATSTPAAVDDPKGQLPRHASMPNLSNLAIVSQTNSASISPHSTSPIPSPVPGGSSGVNSQGGSSHGSSHGSVHNSHGHSHTHLHHSHHPHVSHPYMLAIGHSHSAHHSTAHHSHHPHSIPSRSSSNHSRSSSFSSTHSPPSEEISPASSNSSRTNSPTERLPSSFGTALSGLELKAHHFGDGLRPPFRRRHTDEELIPSDGEMDNDTFKKRRRPALCLLLQNPGEEMCTAIYLEELTVEDLKAQVANKFQLDPQLIRSMTRISKKGLATKVDNVMLEHTEQDEGFQLEVIKEEGAGGGCSLIFRSL